MVGIRPVHGCNDNRYDSGTAPAATPLDKLVYDPTGKDPNLYVRADAKNVILNLVGRVSVDPIAGSMKVARVFDTDLFMDPTGCSATQE